MNGITALHAHEARRGALASALAVHVSETHYEAAALTPRRALTL